MLGDARASAQDPQEDCLEKPTVVFCRVLQTDLSVDLPRQATGVFDSQAAVDQGQRLLGNHCFGSSVTLVCTGRVEEVEEDHHLLGCVTVIDTPAGGCESRGCIQLRPAHPCVKISTDPEHSIADQFGFQSAGVHSPEKTVVGVMIASLGLGWRRTGRHPVGGRREHQPVQVLQVPVAFDQFDGQPIQQCRVSGFLAVVSEVENGCDQWVAKVS